MRRPSPVIFILLFITVSFALPQAVHTKTIREVVTLAIFCFFRSLSLESVSDSAAGCRINGAVRDAVIKAERSESQQRSDFSFWQSAGDFGQNPNR